MTGHGIALLVLVLALVAWVAVQRAWRRAFPELVSDPDVLAARMGPHGCGCTMVCARNPARRAGACQEERS